MRAALASAVLFAAGGGFLVLLGLASILTGTPAKAHDLAPVASLGDVAARLGELAPLLSTSAAVVVVAAVASMVALRRVGAIAATFELLVLGLVIEACIVGSVGRIGHATDGSVLGATVICVMGGASVIAGGIVALLARE
jgi:hypothetical protein